MPHFKCKTCGKKITYRNGYIRRDGVQPARLVAIRRHYKRAHPRKWKEAIRRGVRKRMRRLRRLK